MHETEWDAFIVRDRVTNLYVGAKRTGGSTKWSKTPCLFAEKRYAESCVRGMAKHTNRPEDAFDIKPVRVSLIEAPEPESGPDLWSSSMWVSGDPQMMMDDREPVTIIMHRWAARYLKFAMILVGSGHFDVTDPGIQQSRLRSKVTMFARDLRHRLDLKGVSYL